jgi:sugar lactone lactonase YvrE
LRTLFVTTAAMADEGDDPRAGGVFAVEAGVGGLVENLFRIV